MQNGVTLSTKENELKVILGNAHYLMSDEKPREGAYTSLKYIFSDINNIREYYIKLGFHLEEFRRYEYYHDFGYISFYDFCDKNLGMDKSAVSRCINVYREFNASNYVKYEYGNRTQGSHMALDERYKDYSYSQLCEMVSMDDVQRSQVKPDMTIKQIREIKKNTSSLSESLELLDSLLNDKKNDLSVATSQPKKEKFRFGDYLSKKGIVLYNYIKNLDYDGTCRITIFDKDGKEVYYNVVEVLSNTKNGIYVRMMNDKKEFPEN